MKNNPAVKLLLLHGGPAATHDYFEAFDSFLPMAGVEYYCYDQLGSFYSDHLDDDLLHELPRFVDDVEQVRQALGLNRDNFYLLGHSWGGILATEYALAYQEHLKGLVISNMRSRIPRTKDVAKITVPTLVIGAEPDSMDPKHMEWMSKQFPRGEYLQCPNGSHMDIHDDQETYMKGLIAFLSKQESGLCNGRFGG